MKKIRYCKKCLFPDTKPGLEFDEFGVCSACNNYANRDNVNWDDRKVELKKILDKYRIEDGSNWDCIIPVSGGKDSIYQVLKMKEYGMHPLCVNVTPCGPTDLGRKNMEVLKEFVGGVRCY